MSEEIKHGLQQAVSPQFELVIRYIIYPLVAALVGVIITLYHRDLKTIKKMIIDQKKEHEDDISNLKEDVKGKIDDVKDNIRELFNEKNCIRKDLNEVQQKISVRDNVCKMNHK